MRSLMHWMKAFIELIALVAGVVAAYAAMVFVVIGIPLLVILSLLHLFGII